MNRIAVFVLIAFVCASGAAGAAALSFNEDFNSPVLDPAWTVTPGQGAYSLTARPGYLRYQLTGSTDPRFGSPGTILFRPFEGTDWALEFGVDYDMASGNGRQQVVRVFFGETQTSATDHLGWFRTKDDFGGGPSAGEDAAYTVSGGLVGSSSRQLPMAGGTHFVRMERSGQDVSISRSSDGLLWELYLTHTFGSDIGEDQVVEITGWQFRGGQFALADYDYMRLTGAVPEPGTMGMMLLAGLGLCGVGLRKRFS